MRPTPDNHVTTRQLLWAPAWQAIHFDETVAYSYHHDHDEELGMYWYDKNPAKAVLERPRRTQRDLEYWLETGKLVREYLEMQAAGAYSDNLRQRLITWLQASPARRQQYEGGDDMLRADLVD